MKKTPSSYCYTSPLRGNNFHFHQFLHGSELSFAYIYSHLCGMLRHYGLRIVQDEFVVNTLLQEVFLKLWAYREHMTSMQHIARFLKLNMRWECMAYYRNPMETLYRKTLRLNQEEGWDIAAPLPEEDGIQNRLHLVRSMIPHLPGNRQRTIVSLYVKDGLTVRQIAQRLHTSTQSVTRELNQRLDGLKAMLVVPKKADRIRVPAPAVTPQSIDELSPEEAYIITLRRDMKYSFSQIAALLKQPQEQVQKQYVNAWKKC